MSAPKRPSAGARYEVVRVEDDDGQSPIVYRGFVHLSDADLPLEVTIDRASGAAKAHLIGGTPELEKMAAALLRSATKQAIVQGTRPPRKIVRWRE